MSEPYVTVRYERKQSLPDYGHEVISITVGQIPEHASDDYRQRLYGKAEGIVGELRAILDERFQDAKPRPMVPTSVPPGQNPLLMPVPAAEPPIEPPVETKPVSQEAKGATVNALVAVAPEPPASQPPASAQQESDPDDIVPPEDDSIQFGKGLVTLGHPYSGYEFENHEGHEKVVHEAHRLRQLNSLLNRSGFTDYRHQLARVMFRRTINSLNELTIREAEIMHDFLLHASDDQKKQALTEARK